MPSLLTADEIAVGDVVTAKTQQLWGWYLTGGILSVIFGFVVISFVPQIAVADLNAEELPSYHRNVDNDESVFVHSDGSGRSPATLSHVPQGILHGADEATRAAFNAKRAPGQRRMFTGVSVDTDRPLIQSAAFARASGG